MESGRRNIVQAEFFQVNVRANSLEALMADMRERNADGAALKTTLRFFDEDNQLTAFVLKLQKLERWKARLEVCVMGTTGWRKEFANSLHHTLLVWIRQLQEGCVVLAARQLQAVAEASGEIAIEESDRSFRSLQRNERYEVLTAISKAKGAWIFLFEPNDLLAESNTSVGHVMH